MQKSPKILAKYDYAYPAEAIAQKPAKPRDHARILTFNRATGEVKSDTFLNLARHLSPRSVLVLNQTKVLPARLWACKETGGKVQVFYLGTENGLLRALSEAKLNKGQILKITRDISLTLVERRGRELLFKTSFPISHISSILERYGTTPIPPYIKHSPLSESQLRREYQTVFARVAGSVAAPTASLHITQRLIDKLKKAGHEIRYVTLTVGLGTFAPITEENLKTGRLHKESYNIDARTIRFLNAAKRSGRPVVAVGTTVARTLESASDTSGILRRLSGETTLFIKGSYRWRFVDALITNFHVPRSSLLMLVSSFAKDRQRLLGLYRLAIASGFRLFSFGDGMLIK